MQDDLSQGALKLPEVKDLEVKLYLIKWNFFDWP